MLNRTISRLAQALSLLWLASYVPTPLGRADFLSAALPDVADPAADPRIETSSGESK